MMKTRSNGFSLSFGIVLIAILLIHLLLVYTKIFELDFKMAAILDGTLFFLFGAGIVLIAPGFKKDPENFVGRFMILTTVQLLAILSLVFSVIYNRVVDFRSFSFHLMALFVFLLAIQSFLLIKGLKKRIK